MSTIQIVKTQPYAGQKPGTSGLRKKVVEFQKPHYLENFVQCIFDSLPADELKGSTLVCAGDGRFFNQAALTTIIRMSAAAGVSKIITGVNGLMSTPCVSHIIRATKSYGGIILTASHNPGGPHEDFGIKYNCSNGGPAPEGLTDAMYKKTTQITEYKIVQETPQFSFSQIGSHSFGSLTVEIMDAASAYCDYMKTIFDFDLIRSLVKRQDFSLIFDAMHGVAGPFAKKVFAELGAKEGSVMNADPKEDFGGGHPDPNLTYAHDLTHLMGLNSKGVPLAASEMKGDINQIPDFGAACDGDADRNMILGRQFFVTPSDSVAIIAAHAALPASENPFPYFAKQGLKGVARSMPTSAALDAVASALNLPCYEVPTGWKFFGNLMDAGKIQICGEESFGTGSDHIREKDGLWAVLAWLSILAYHNKKSQQFVSIRDIVLQHWAKFGRNYYTRYDYEGVDSGAADKLMAHLLEQTKKLSSSSPASATLGSFHVVAADEFSYKDPVDGSISTKQGMRFLLENGGRIIFRLSGTGSVGATIRVYIEQLEKNKDKLQLETQAALETLVQTALDLCQMEHFTGRKQPTVIT